MASIKFLLLLLLLLRTVKSGLSSEPAGLTGNVSLNLLEATVDELQLAFAQKRLTSRQLTEFYIARIRRLNPVLRSVIEINPDALRQALKADRERRAGERGGLHGIPVLLKDNIATKDRMNTTAGSLALVRSVVARDAGVVARLRRAGAVILGKASLSEWANFRGNAPSGWCARSGQGKNPYNLSADPCGSSSGSAISASANMAAVTLGTETDGSILCPSSSNSVVGIKPTVGLTSRGGVIPITPRQDTVGPICRTVSDAVNVLDAIVGYDSYDARATRAASKHIPRGGYKQFLKPNGLKGKRLGIIRKGFFGFPKGSLQGKVFERHFTTLRRKGAILADNLVIDYDSFYNGTSEKIAMLYEFKVALNVYLKDLVSSPVQSLKDVIAFNNKHKAVEKIDEYNQQFFELAQMTDGTDDPEYKSSVHDLARINRNGFVKFMKRNKLDAVVTPGSDVSPILAIGGHPGINVPAGYEADGVPFGICFSGLRGSEPKLIEIAYAFEQATKIRRPPSFS